MISFDLFSNLDKRMEGIFGEFSHEPRESNDLEESSYTWDIQKSSNDICPNAGNGQRSSWGQKWVDIQSTGSSPSPISSDPGVASRVLRCRCHRWNPSWTRTAPRGRWSANRSPESWLTPFRQLQGDLERASSGGSGCRRSWCRRSCSWRWSSRSSGKGAGRTLTGSGTDLYSRDSWAAPPLFRKGYRSDFGTCSWERMARTAAAGSCRSAARWSSTSARNNLQEIWEPFSSRRSVWTLPLVGPGPSRLSLPQDLGRGVLPPD